MKMRKLKVKFKVIVQIHFKELDFNHLKKTTREERLLGN